MGCIHTSNNNKSRIIICPIELKYYIYIFNQSVICRIRRLEAICHMLRSRVRGDPSFVIIEVERINKSKHYLECLIIFNHIYVVLNIILTTITVHSLKQRYEEPPAHSNEKIPKDTKN